MMKSNFKTYIKKEHNLRLLKAVLMKATGDMVVDINNEARSLTRFTMREWNRLTTMALIDMSEYLDNRRGQENKLSKVERKKIISIFDKKFKNFGQKISEKSNQTFTRIYRLEKQIQSLRFRLEDDSLVYFNRKVKTSRVVKQEEDLTAESLTAIGVSFTVEDKRTVEELNKLHISAAGAHYSTKMKKELVNTIEDAVNNLGLPKREAAIYLREEMSRKMGGLHNAVPAAISAQGIKAQTNYFRMLSETNMNRARTYSQLNTFSEVGIEQFIWASILDKRTSPICREMNGRIFTVEMGKQQMNGILELEDPDLIKSEYPWQRNLDQARSNLGTNDIPKNIDGARMLLEQQVPILPPAHGSCRSEIVPA